MLEQKAKPTIVDVKNVSRIFNYNGKHTIAVNNISLRSSYGELLLILGPSGSGKTTLLTLIAGLIKPTSGNVFLFGNDIALYSSKELQQLRAKQIGFVFQNFLLIDSFNVEENISIVCRFAGLTCKQTRERTSQLLKQMHIEGLAKKYPPQLSQGEKQRAAIARATVVSSELIIADEPTASLETNQGFEVIELLHRYAIEENKSVIVASHDLRLMKFTDKILQIEDGKIKDMDIE